MVILTNRREFEEHVLSNTKAVLVIACWDHLACRREYEQLLQLSRSPPDMDICFLPMDAAPELADALGIVGSPTFRFYREGRLIWQSLGKAGFHKNMIRHMKS